MIGWDRFKPVPTNGWGRFNSIPTNPVAVARLQLQLLITATGLVGTGSILSHPISSWVNVLILLHHALQYIILEIHSGPNLLGNYKAYISSVFKRYRFCSSTVLVCAFNLFVCLIWGKFTVHMITIINNGL